MYPYVVMVTYRHPERFTEGAFVRVGYERGQLEIFSCKYQFACRQFATDGNKRPKYFNLTGTPDTHEIKLESSVSSKIAMVLSYVFIFVSRKLLLFLSLLTSKNEVRERIPVPHDNYLESIISSRPHCKGYFCLLFPCLHDVNLLTDQ